jgi:hypothetical protein
MTPTPGYTELLQAIHELGEGGNWAVASPLLARAAELQRVRGRAKQLSASSEPDIATAKLVRCACGEPMVCPECTAKLGEAQPLASQSVERASPAKDGGERVPLDHGKLWLFMRSVLEQGRSIQMDNATGKYERYEQLSARIDCAARERADEFEAQFTAPQPLASQMRPQSAVQGWQPVQGWQQMNTLPDSNDLVWLRRGDAVEGPREPKDDDVDYWDLWCYCEPPAAPQPPQGEG